MKFQLFNLSQKAMNISLDINESQQTAIQILAFEPPGSEHLGLIQPGNAKEFNLRLFPLSAGLNQLTGLIIKDYTNADRSEVNFHNICKIYVDK